MTFQLNKDFVIAISSDVSKPAPLSIGMNKMKGEEEMIHMYEVKRNPTHAYGMCYVIIPKQLLMKPFQDTLMISIAKNITSEKINHTIPILKLISTCPLKVPASLTPITVPNQPNNM